MPTKEEKLELAKPHLYGASRMLVVEPISRKAGRLQSNNAADMNICNKKGNNKKINARIHDAF
jgi:hypothetical protein